MDGYKLELCKSLEKEELAHEELIEYVQNNGLNYYFSTPSWHPLVEEFQKLYYILYETEFSNKDIFWQRYLSFDFASLLSQIVIFQEQLNSKRKMSRKRHGAESYKKTNTVVVVDPKTASCSTTPTVKESKKTNDKSKVKKSCK